MQSCTRADVGIGPYAYHRENFVGRDAHIAPLNNFLGDNPSVSLALDSSPYTGEPLNGHHMVFLTPKKQTPGDSPAFVLP